MFRLVTLLLVGAGVLACATAKFEPVVRPLSYDPGGSCTPRGGPPSDAALRESAEVAQTLVDDILAALSNEYPELRRQFIPREREPIQRFPRLTFPALADPTPAADGSARKAAWLFPLILDRRQLGDVPPEAVTGEFAFWLVPHGADVGPNSSRRTRSFLRSRDASICSASSSRSRPERPAPACR
jgi:hypothetical protein